LRSKTGQHSSESSANQPEQIGQYRIVRLLGEGGMGTVYEAADTGPVRRHVALKIVRGGLDSREVRTRFDAERQALALMDHAGIAKVFNAGETESGDPFFAMELVKGLPINEYCDSRRLSTPERLELFISVCDAVQHAHQKGVIHRDLKPSNILVTEQDGKPLPKIIDFGIAKALGQRLSEETFVTHVGQPVGTAAFMSPEQAESSGIDVDTRTDIYSLGVILYMLLVGSLPVDPAGVPMHAFMYRLASGDTQTPRPSVRFTALGDYREGIAQARRTDPDKLQRDLDGDLDWITMKALAPERARRYATAVGLAADINRFLANEPVTARPPTPRYRLQKFIRRHRGAMLATSFAAVALVASAILAAAGMVRATRAERKAANEAAAAREVSGFLIDLFKVFDPSRATGNEITARELLDRGAERSAALARQPILQSRMMQTIGTAYASLGLYPAARAQLERALEARRQTLGPDDPEVAETELSLGDAISDHGDYADAEQHYRAALAIDQKVLRPDDQHLATVVAGLASLRYRQGRYKEAESLYQRALAIDERSTPRDDRILARHLVGHGVVKYAQQRFTDAEDLMRRGLSIQERVLRPDEPELAATLSNLGGVYWSEGRYSDALPLYERTRAIFERTLDPTHPDVASILNNLAETYWKLHRNTEAEPLFRRALAIKELRLVTDDPRLATTLNGLAGVLREQRRFGESETAYKRALAIRTRAFNRGDASIAETLRDYSGMLRAAGRLKEADELLVANGLTR